MKGGALVFILLSLSIPVCAQGPRPSITGSAVDSKDAPRKNSTNAEIKSNSLRPAIIVPPEKANPVSIPRFEKPPVIDGRLDDDIWKQARIFKDFYQTQPGDNIA